MLCLRNLSFDRCHWFSVIVVIPPIPWWWWKWICLAIILICIIIIIRGFCWSCFYCANIWFWRMGMVLVIFLFRRSTSSTLKFSSLEPSAWASSYLGYSTKYCDLEILFQSLCLYLDLLGLWRNNLLLLMDHAWCFVDSICSSYTCVLHGFYRWSHLHCLLGPSWR